ncbi:MAG: hypothetical protein NTV46_04855, partial [Verrucomicrobia bacterium]|nr:hypothetical protein [Verrucomicrobiota bacterium]
MSHHPPRPGLSTPHSQQATQAQNRTRLKTSLGLRTGEDLVISMRGRPVARVVAAKAAKPWL